MQPTQACPEAPSLPILASPRRVAVALVLVLPRPTSSADDNEGPAPPPQPSCLVVCSRKKQHLYVFPKGGIEHGESPQEAAHRESWEEAGLIQGTATHLTHLLTLADPSPHILSPSRDPTSPSFVASCEYSFELFVLEAPPSTAATAAAPLAATTPVPAPVPALASVAAPHDHASPSASALSLAVPSTPSSVPSSAASSPPASSAPSPTSHPPPAPLPSHLSPILDAYSAAYLAPTWPESGERHRRWIHGWDDIERQVCWGRREGVMREACERAREWVDAWWARGARIEEDDDDDDQADEEQDADEQDEDDEEGKGRL